MSHLLKSFVHVPSNFALFSFLHVCVSLLGHVAHNISFLMIDKNSKGPNTSFPQNIGWNLDQNSHPNSICATYDKENLKIVQ